MILNRLSQFIAGCILVNAIFIGIAIKYSGEDISFTTLLIKIGVPLFISEAVLMITLYPDETIDTLIGDVEFFRDTFQPASEQTFISTNRVHAMHSHGDVPQNNLDAGSLRRRSPIFTDNS